MKKVFGYVVWTLTVACMVTIFLFSSQDAQESSETSSDFTVQILSVFTSFENLSAEQQEQTVANLQFAVRKCAHFSVYTCLGVLMKLSFLYLPIKKRGTLFSFISCVLYAVSDEIHQYFVAGRSCEIRDMTIDSLGALLGISLTVFCIYLIKRKRQNKTNRDENR